MFSELDGFLPMTLVIEKLMGAVECLRVDINRAQADIRNIEQWITDFREGQERKAESRMSLPGLDEIEAQAITIKMGLTNSMSKLQTIGPALASFMIPPSVLVHILEKLIFLGDRSHRLSDIIKFIQIKPLFHDMRKRGGQISHRFADSISPMKDLAAAIVPREPDIEDMIAEVNTISSELHQVYDLLS
jgi:hypothetical protein